MASEEVTPYRVAIAEEQIRDLRERLARTRWPESETVPDWSQGIPLAYVQEVCRYWERDYDMRRVETQLNALPQFRSEIEGVGIHFLHVRSPHEQAVPLVLTHGWPGSVVEFLKVIGPLTDPPAHGGDAGDAFHLVVPSLPGYGFSDRPTDPGWGVAHIAAVWDQLMGRLGYERYAAQGGDWGAIVTTMLGRDHAPHLIGIHLNLALCSPAALLALGDPTPEEQQQLGLLQSYMEWEAGYSQQQSTRPQTLGYGLVDSPAGQCAWVLEKFKAWCDCDGHPENVLSRDELLDNVMVYWLTATGASSARLYWESLKAAFVEFDEVTVPAGYSMFKDLFQFSERWVRTRYTGLQYYNALDRGGHFAAFEQPATFVQEVRASFRPLR
jgi:pimeloyl-ACP methyl ester carboxylesterase